MFLEKGQEELDSGQRYQKCHQHFREQYRAFRGGKRLPEIHQLNRTGPEHDRNSQQERRLCSRSPRYPNHERPDNRRAESGGSRKHSGNELEQSNLLSCLIGQLCRSFHNRRSAFVPLFYCKEQDTEQGQHDDHHLIIEKQGVQLVAP